MSNTKLVAIQPTPFCNIDCRYCYLPQRTSKKRISVETLSKIAHRLFSASFVKNDLTIVWHMGEPLTLPVSFYERAHEIIQSFNRNDVNVTFSVQTNATMIDQAWCDFFTSYDVQVGVSLDGPRHLNDANRVDRAGRGTFDRALRGIRLLQQNGIDPPVIMVVTKDALADPEEVWQFFAENGFTYVGFNSEEEEGANTESSLRGHSHFALFRDFIRRILVLESSLQSGIEMREFDNLMRYIQGNHAMARNQDNVPLAILTFDCEGNVSTFSPELLTTTHQDYGDFLFGNVHDNSLDEIFSTAKFTRVNTEIQRGVENCKRSCEYFAVCGGGSPSNKICENGDFASTETQACKLRVKATTDAVLDFLEFENERSESLELM